MHATFHPMTVEMLRKPRSFTRDYSQSIFSIFLCSFFAMGGKVFSLLFTSNFFSAPDLGDNQLKQKLLLNFLPLSQIITKVVAVAFMAEMWNYCVVNHGVRKIFTISELTCCGGILASFKFYSTEKTTCHSTVHRGSE